MFLFLFFLFFYYFSRKKFMALLAFAIAVNGASTLGFTINCQNPTAPTTQAGVTSSPGFSLYTASFSYPYG
jgi:hypothetical protein